MNNALVLVSVDHNAEPVTRGHANCCFQLIMVFQLHFACNMTDLVDCVKVLINDLTFCTAVNIPGDTS